LILITVLFDIINVWRELNLPVPLEQKERQKMFHHFLQIELLLVTLFVLLPAVILIVVRIAVFISVGPVAAL